MFTNIVSRLKAIFRPMSESGPNIIPSKSPFTLSERPDTLDIKSYLHSIARVLAAHRDRWDMLQEHVVTKVHYVKEKNSNSNHEYLVVTLVDHDGETAHLMVERGKDPNAGIKAPFTDSEPEAKVKFALLAPGDSSGPSALQAPTTASWSANRLLSLASASHSVNSINSDTISTSASLPESSQDSLSKPRSASDVISRLVHNFRPPSTHTAILVFEPSSEPEMRITLLHLCVIIEAVHDFKPNYQLLRSQCYWFAMTIFGILLLHGGRLKSYPLHPSRRDVDPNWTQMEPLTPSSPDFFNLPIPEPPDDLKAILKTIKGTGEYLGLPIIKPCIDDIWKLHVQSKKDYAKTKVELFNQQNILEKSQMETREAKMETREAKRETREANERATKSERETREANERAAKSEGETREANERAAKFERETREATERAAKFERELVAYRATTDVNPDELEVRA